MPRQTIGPIGMLSPDGAATMGPAGSTRPVNQDDLKKWFVESIKRDLTDPKLREQTLQDVMDYGPGPMALSNKVERMIEAGKIAEATAKRYSPRLASLFGVSKLLGLVDDTTGSIIKAGLNDVKKGVRHTTTTQMSYPKTSPRMDPATALQLRNRIDQLQVIDKAKKPENFIALKNTPDARLSDLASTQMANVFDLKDPAVIDLLMQDKVPPRKPGNRAGITIDIGALPKWRQALADVTGLKPGVEIPPVTQAWPTDGATVKAGLMHEGMERAQGEGIGLMGAEFGSHVGVRPRIADRQAAMRDPLVYMLFRRMSEGTGSKGEDLFNKMYGEYGGTAGHPLPLFGKQIDKFERAFLQKIVGNRTGIDAKISKNVQQMQDRGMFDPALPASVHPTIEPMPRPKGNK